MVSREIVTKLFAKYKHVEKVFFRADKSEDKTGYIKLKYQFRMTFALSITSILLAFLFFVLYKTTSSFPVLLLASGLIGFRFKWYNLPRTMVFIAMTTITVIYYTNDLMFAVPASILFTNFQSLIFTQSQSFTILHLIIQSFILYFYGMEKVTKRLQGMTPDEIAELAKAGFYYSLLGTWVSLITMQGFYAHTSKLLRKIGALWNNLSKVNSQLHDQNLKLQSNLEMKDVFIYTFSHELKNALNGLLGNLYLAYDTAKDPQVLQFLSLAKVCGEVLKNFVHNILDSGKLENGNLEVSPERKDVMHFMQDVWAIRGRIIQNKRLQGCLEIEKSVPRFLELDEQRMIQIILNLVSNAVKFTEKGHVSLRITWQPISTACTQRDHFGEEASHIEENKQATVLEEEKGEVTFYGDVHEFLESLEGSPSKRENHHLMTEYQKKFITEPQFYQLNLMKPHWVQGEILSSKLSGGSKGLLKIQVLDSGCGMTPEAQTKLFQKFSQVNQAPGQRKVGTGLGLWICKELTNRLDGEIKTRSAVSVGSVFELAITTKVSHVAGKPQNSASLSQHLDNLDARVIRNQRPPNMMKTLIVDDDCFNIELMKNYPIKFGISYILAYDGEEAVMLFKKHYHEICFVITDNFMPKKTGAEAAVEIADFLKEMNKPRIPIMCISGDVKVSVSERGITTVIQKPINFDRLKQELMIIYPELTQVTDIGRK